jgi:hypothetical protein
MMTNDEAQGLYNQSTEAYSTNFKLQSEIYSLNAKLAVALQEQHKDREEKHSIYQECDKLRKDLELSKAVLSITSGVQAEKDQMEQALAASREVASIAKNERDAAIIERDRARAKADKLEAEIGRYSDALAAARASRTPEYWTELEFCRKSDADRILALYRETEHLKQEIAARGKNYDQLFASAVEDCNKLAAARTEIDRLKAQLAKAEALSQYRYEGNVAMSGRIGKAIKTLKGDVD